MKREIQVNSVRHARLLPREHVRIVQPNGQSMALNMLYPYPYPAPSSSAASVSR